MRHYKSFILLALALTLTVGVNAKGKKDKKAKDQTEAVASDADNEKQDKKEKKEKKSKKEKEVTEEEVSALQISLAKVLHNHGALADTLAKDLSNRFANSAKMQCAIGRAYYTNRNRDKIPVYLSKAIQLDPTEPLPYLIYGNTWNGDTKNGAFELNVDSAAYYYNKAIELDPKDPKPYIGLATAYAYNTADSMKMAKATMERLRQANPEYDTDLAMGDIYIKVYEDPASVAKYLGNSDPNKLSQFYLGKLVVNEFDAFEYDKCSEHAKIGMDRFPENKNFGKFYARSLMFLGDYANAVKYGKEFIETLPKDSLTSRDLYCMGTAYLGVGELDKGFATYDRIKEMNDDWSNSMNQEFLFKNVSAMVSHKVKDKKYDEAEALQKKLMEVYPYTDGAQALDDLSNIYLMEVDDKTLSEETRKKVMQDKLSPTYEKLETNYPDYDGLGEILYYHAVFTTQILDPESTEGTAVPIANRLIDYMSKKPAGTLSTSEMNYASTACNIVAFYYFKGLNNTNGAISYWQKALRFNPDDSQAYSILSQLNALPGASKSTKKRK